MGRMSFCEALCGQDVILGRHSVRKRPSVGCEAGFFEARGSFGGCQVAVRGL